MDNRKTGINEIRNIVKTKLDYDTGKTDDEILEIITDTVFSMSVDEYISPTQKKKLIEGVFNSIRRLDIIQNFLNDESITEIMVNGPDRIFIEKNGHIEKAEIHFESTKKLVHIIHNIVSKVNRVVNESNPIVDARLENGSRVNVVLPPVALNGPILTIRKFSTMPFTSEKLIEIGAVTKEAMDIIARMVMAGCNIFISGGTGSGKTTLLNVLSNFIPKSERIITIEDSAELRISGVDNLVSLETRNSNYDESTTIDMKELIRTSLRMRPDRIIVGEVRGAEALDMLQAMNTGHDGSISTGHGNSCKDIINRLETMVLTSVSMPLQAIRMQIASALDIIIHVSRMRDKTRKITAITEIAGISDGCIELNMLYEFKETGEKKIDFVEGQLIRTGNKLINTDKFIRAGINYSF